MAWGDFKDLSGRRSYDKIFCDKAFNIAKNSKYDGYQSKPVSMIYKFFDKSLLVLLFTLWFKSILKNNN